MTAMTDNKKEYEASSITVLEGLQAVREIRLHRPLLHRDVQRRALGQARRRGVQDHVQVDEETDQPLNPFDRPVVRRFFSHMDPN